MKIRSEEEIRRSLTHPQQLRLIGQLARRKEAAREQRKEISDEENAKAMRLIITAGLGKGAFRGRRGAALKTLTMFEPARLGKGETKELGQKLIDVATRVGRAMLETPLGRLGQTKKDQGEVTHLIRNSAFVVSAIGQSLLYREDVRKLKRPFNRPKTSK